MIGKYFTRVFLVSFVRFFDKISTEYYYIFIKIYNLPRTIIILILLLLLLIILIHVTCCIIYTITWAPPASDYRCSVVGRHTGNQRRTLITCARRHKTRKKTRDESLLWLLFVEDKNKISALIENRVARYNMFAHIWTRSRRDSVIFSPLLTSIVINCTVG